MTEFSPVHFTHPGFIRAAKAPTQEQINGFFTSALSRFIILSEGACDVYAPDNLYLHQRSDLLETFPSVTAVECTFLGFLADQPLLSIVVPRPDALRAVFVPLPTLHFSLIDRISQPVLAAYVFAKFHLNTHFCSRCAGQLTFLDQTRTYLRCCGCNRDVYPTISPCVIFTVSCADRILLGLRGTEIFTNFSGFLEVSECPIQAVTREFEEETGIPRTQIARVTSLETSQPWGNQYGEESLMLCYAIELREQAPAVPTEEVHEMRWVSLKEWEEAARRTDGAQYQSEAESWKLPRIGTAARWMMEKAWEHMGLWHRE